MSSQKQPTASGGLRLLIGGLVALFLLLAAAIASVQMFIPSVPLAPPVKSIDAAQQAMTDEQRQARLERERVRLESEKKAAKDAAEDRAHAKAWSITVGAAKRAREQESYAYAACAVALESSARYDYKSDWLPNYAWISEGDAIVIHGRDIHLQNGYGAYAGGYYCKWNIADRKVVYANADTD